MVKFLLISALAALVISPTTVAQQPMDVVSIARQIVWDDINTEKYSDGVPGHTVYIRTTYTGHVMLTPPPLTCTTFTPIPHVSLSAMWASLYHINNANPVSIKFDGHCSKVLVEIRFPITYQSTWKIYKGVSGLCPPYQSWIMPATSSSSIVLHGTNSVYFSTATGDFSLANYLLYAPAVTAEISVIFEGQVSDSNVWYHSSAGPWDSLLATVASASVDIQYHYPPGSHNCWQYGSVEYPLLDVNIEPSGPAIDGSFLSGGCAASTGISPVLVASGSSSVGGQLTLDGTNLKPTESVFLALSSSSVLGLSVFGCDLIADIGVGVLIAMPTTVGPYGSAVTKLHAVVPSIPQATSIYAQLFVTDSAKPSGFSVSNAAALVLY